ncbi:MAG: T9SS type A sorting domain-containing protein [Agriterribacter sp.]
MRLIFTLLFLFLIVSFSAKAQVPGCMDPQATNYNPSATVNNGSCTYNATNASLSNKGELPSPPLTEISGMAFVDGKLFANIDGGAGVRNVLYEIDTTTLTIARTITLEETTNRDWEEITSDGTYMYIGDFGNNSNGNRTDLRVYRVPLTSITAITGTTGTVAAEDIDVINFSYSDQTDFTATGGNNTAFDCEAFIYHSGSLHLFTKNWIGDKTVHYKLSATPGTHEAVKVDEFDIGGELITAATKSNDNIITLLSHSNPFRGFDGSTSIWIISGFSDIDNLFATGNKREINLSGNYFSNGQIEGVAAVHQTRVLISNEDNQSNFGIAPRLVGLNMETFVAQTLLPFGIDNFTTRLTDSEVLLTWEYNEPGAAYFEVEAASTASGSYSYLGKVFSNPAGGTYSFTDVNFDDATIKYYRIKVVTPDGKNYYSKILPVKKDDSKLFNLVATPSPFTSGFNVSFYSDTDQVIRLSIVDMHGRAVNTRQLQTNRGRYNFTVDGLNGLSQGVYFLTARTKKDLFVRKIVKQ